MQILAKPEEYRQFCQDLFIKKANEAKEEMLAEPPSLLSTLVDIKQQKFLHPEKIDFVKLINSEKGLFACSEELFKADVKLENEEEILANLGSNSTIPFGFFHEFSLNSA